MSDGGMRVAGIAEPGGPVETLTIAGPRPLAGDEVLVEVRCAGVANWDDIVRTGGWDVGAAPPMALGVEASGVIAEVGDGVSGWAHGDDVMTHPLPLRDQGAWAPWLIAPAALLAPKPGRVSWEAAAAFPVPALTAEQVLQEALSARSRERILVHGAGGVTGRMLVALAALAGLEVIATAGPANHPRLRELGAAHLFDYRDEGWSAKVRELTGGGGVECAANAVRGAAAEALAAVGDGGRMATITGDPPPEERGIAVSNVYVRPDGEQLQHLAALLEEHELEPDVVLTAPLEEAGAALERAASGHAGGAVVLRL